MRLRHSVSLCALSVRGCPDLVGRTTLFLYLFLPLYLQRILWLELPYLPFSFLYPIPVSACLCVRCVCLSLGWGVQYLCETGLVCRTISIAEVQWPTFTVGNTINRLVGNTSCAESCTNRRFMLSRTPLL